MVHFVVTKSYVECSSENRIAKSFAINLRLIFGLPHKKIAKQWCAAIISQLKCNRTLFLWRCEVCTLFNPSSFYLFSDRLFAQISSFLISQLSSSRRCAKFLQNFSVFVKHLDGAAKLLRKTNFSFKNAIDIKKMRAGLQG